VSDRPEQAVNAAGPGAPPSTPHDPDPSTAAGAPRTRTRDVSLGRQLDAGAAPVDRPAAGMWLLYAALGFLGGQVLAALLAAVAAAIAGQYHQLTALSKLAEPPTWFVMSTLLGLWGGFLGAGVLASRLRGTSRLTTDLGLRFRWIDVLGIPIGIAGQYLVALMYVPIKPHVHDFSQRFSAPAQRLTGGSHGPGYAVIVIATVVGAPFFEELFFRGVLLRAFARLFGRFGRWVGPCLAVLVSGVLFGLAHAESLQLLGLATFGVILGAVSYRTGRLGMNMVAHASFNALALAAVVVPALAGARGLV
jgi:membrane protease YdiL (CAAX protease family)